MTCKILTQHSLSHNVSYRRYSRYTTQVISHDIRKANRSLPRAAMKSHRFSSAKARKYIIHKSLQDSPTRDDFQTVTKIIPTIDRDKFEIVVKTEWLSVESYWPVSRVPNVYYALQVGTVTHLTPYYSSIFSLGDKVVFMRPWCDHHLLNENVNAHPLKSVNKIPDLRGLSESLAVGAVGLPGASAHHGVVDLCRPERGDTVLIADAASQVGSIAGQIARIKRCRVIGFADTEEKCRWLEAELGFHEVFNYEADIREALKEAAPDGVDCYLDSVGGELSRIVLEQMNTHGRVVACGNVEYGELPKEKEIQVSHLPLLYPTRRKLKGYTSQLPWGGEWGGAFGELVEWIRTEQLKVHEHITEGFENAYDAWSRMASGKYVGTHVIKACS